MPFTSSFKSIDASHRLRITIEQIGQNVKNKTSDVKVRGWLYNDSDYRNWNLDPVVDRSIFGEDHWNPANFSFDLGPHENMIFIEHVFTVDHNDNGTKTVNFTVRYGDTQISTFDGPQQLGDSLVLDRIGKKPDAPGPVTFTNVGPRSLTARWTASPNDNGSPILEYILLLENPPPNRTQYMLSRANNLSRNITGLTPGHTYIFTVKCRNAIGDSPWTDDRDITMIRGASVQVDGRWQATAAYVRNGGKWKIAVPWIRDGGVWKKVK